MSAGPRTAASLATPWPWVLSVAGAALLLSHHGYAFQLNDQLQYLLLPYRELYPDFALGDWFTWQTAHYHLSFSWLVRGLHAVAGEGHFADALFVAHALCLAWLCFGIDRLSRATGAGTAGTWVSLLVLAWVREAGIAGATFNHGQLVPADLAMPPLLLACAAWLSGRYLATGAWLGVSGLLHANFAVLGPLLIGLAEAAHAARTGPSGKGQRWLMAGAAYGALAAPSLWLIGASFFAGDKQPDAVDIVFRIRSPHHYDLGALPAADFWWPALLVAWALPALWHHGRAPWRRLYFLHLAVVGWLLAGLLGTVAAVGPLIRLFFWRLSPLWFVLLLCASACQLRDAFGPQGPRRRASWLWLVTGALAMTAFARSDMAQVAPLSLPPSWFGLPAVAAVALASVGALQGRVWVAGAAAGLALAIAAHSLAAPPHEHLRAGILRKPVTGGPRLGRFVWDDQHKHVKHQELVQWVREHSDPGSRFLIPPSLITFRIRTRRAVFVDFKAAPMRGQDAVEWRRRMLAAMGTAHFDVTGYPLRYQAGERYDARPLAELAALARREGMDYVVTTKKPNARRAGLHLVFTGETHSIYRVLPPKP